MSTGSTQPLRVAGTVAIQAGTTSATAPLPAGGDAVLVSNPLAAWAFVALGVAVTTTPETASATVPAGTPIPPGGSRLLACPSSVTSAPVILGGGTGGSVYFTRCDGSTY